MGIAEMTSEVEKKKPANHAFVAAYGRQGVLDLGEPEGRG
jgi:hypothetical protein